VIEIDYQLSSRSNVEIAIWHYSLKLSRRDAG
jgi:hypothetical protein